MKFLLIAIFICLWGPSTHADSSADLRDIEERIETLYEWSFLEEELAGPARAQFYGESGLDPYYGVAEYRMALAEEIAILEPAEFNATLSVLIGHYQEASVRKWIIIEDLLQDLHSAVSSELASYSDRDTLFDDIAVDALYTFAATFGLGGGRGILAARREIVRHGAKIKDALLTVVRNLPRFNRKTLQNAAMAGIPISSLTIYQHLRSKKLSPMKQLRRAQEHLLLQCTRWLDEKCTHAVGYAPYLAYLLSKLTDGALNEGQDSTRLILEELREIEPRISHLEEAAPDLHYLPWARASVIQIRAALQRELEKSETPEVILP